MEEIILKYIEMLKEKHRLKYTRCKHKWTTVSRYSIGNHKDRFQLFSCSECGEFKQVDLLELF